MGNPLCLRDSVDFIVRRWRRRLTKGGRLGGIRLNRACRLRLRGLDGSVRSELHYRSVRLGLCSSSNQLLQENLTRDGRNFRLSISRVYSARV
jgi:hypothetical protein